MPVKRRKSSHAKKKKRSARHLAIGTVRKGWKVAGHKAGGGNRWVKAHKGRAKKKRMKRRRK